MREDWVLKVMFGRLHVGQNRICLSEFVVYLILCNFFNNKFTFGMLLECCDYSIFVSYFVLVVVIIIIII